MPFVLAVLCLVIFVYRRDLGWSLGALGLLAVSVGSVCYIPSGPVREVLPLFGLALLALGSTLIVRELLKDPEARQEIRGLGRHDHQG